MSGKRIAILNYVLASAGSAGTYAMMVVEAEHAAQWTHIVTLTPLLPYLVAAALAYRHRHRARFGAALTLVILVTVGVGWPLFWTYYMPANTRPATRVTVKIVAPILQAVLVIAVGLAMELIIARQGDASRQCPDEWVADNEQSNPDS